MLHSVTWIDRLRIERVVWALDQRLYDLPRKSRIATRREVRGNLLEAVRDVGVTDALHRLGNSRKLAAGYLVAEFGEDPRPYWVAAAIFSGLALLVYMSLLSEATSAFGDGILSAKPHATGTFTWSGIRYLQDTVTYTFVHGEGSSVGGALTPLSWGIWIGVTVLVGRLWRVPGAWRRRHTTATTTF